MYRRTIPLVILKIPIGYGAVGGKTIRPRLCKNKCVIEVYSSLSIQRKTERVIRRQAHFLYHAWERSISLQKAKYNERRKKSGSHNGVATPLIQVLRAVSASFLRYGKNGTASLAIHSNAKNREPDSVIAAICIDSFCRYF